MSRLYENRVLRVAARIFLGGVFLYAAAHKIMYPPGFAKEIVPYGLLPDALVNLWAIYLPWLELLVGLGLVLGLWVRTSALITAALVVMFLVAIGSRFARGEFDFDCGCFAKTDTVIDDIPVLAQLKWFFFTSPKAYVTFARDLVFLALALFTIRAYPSRPAAHAAAGARAPGNAARG